MRVYGDSFMWSFEGLLCFGTASFEPEGFCLFWAPRWASLWGWELFLLSPSFLFKTRCNRNNTHYRLPTCQSVFSSVVPLDTDGYHNLANEHHVLFNKTLNSFKVLLNKLINLLLFPEIIAEVELRVVFLFPGRLIFFCWPLRHFSTGFRPCPSFIYSQ